MKLFADALRTVARQGDLLVRLGGEEFVWLCRGAAADQGPALCERLLRQLREQPLKVNGQPLHVAASLGFVHLPTWPDTASDWDDALKIVDYAVYCRKPSGRDGWTGSWAPSPRRSSLACRRQRWKNAAGSGVSGR